MNFVVTHRFDPCWLNVSREPKACSAKMESPSRVFQRALRLVLAEATVVPAAEPKRHGTGIRPRLHGPPPPLRHQLRTARPIAGSGKPRQTPNQEMCLDSLMPLPKPRRFAIQRWGLDPR